MWHYRNKAFHDALSFDDVQVSQYINKISMEHFIAWHQVPALVELWLPPTSPGYKINFHTTIRDSFPAQAAVCQNHQVISLV
jgi:hypothetical protein